MWTRPQSPAILSIAASANSAPGSIASAQAQACRYQRLGQCRIAQLPPATRQDRARLEELKAKAILEPTSDNIIAYVRYQREQLDRASTFADVWERAIWQHPDLDYTLQRPVSTLGKTAWLAQRKTDREAVIASLSERYGLFFFYSSSRGLRSLLAHRPLALGQIPPLGSAGLDGRRPDARLSALCRQPGPV
jgi:hypothetical protein